MDRIYSGRPGRPRILPHFGAAYPMVGNGFLDSLGPIGGILKVGVPGFGLLSQLGMGRKTKKQGKRKPRKAKK